MKARPVAAAIPVVMVRERLLAPAAWRGRLEALGLAWPEEITRYLFDDADLLVSPEGGCSVLLRGFGPLNGAP